MVDVAKVKLYGETIGIFRWDDRNNIVQFEYEKKFIGRGLEPAPLMMPVILFEMLPSPLFL